MTDDKAMSDIQALRWGIGRDILIAMENGEDLPLPNVNMLTKVMQEYCITGDYVEELPETSTWRPSAHYWKAHMEQICRLLRKKNRFFFYDREWGDLKGLWKFGNKEEYERYLSRKYQGMSKRSDLYNEELDASKWRHRHLLHIADIPRLESVS